MNSEIFSEANQLNAKHISDSIPELEIVFDPTYGWEWQDNHTESDTWFTNPLDALIDFTIAVLAELERETKQVENDDE